MAINQLNRHHHPLKLHCNREQQCRAEQWSAVQWRGDVEKNEVKSERESEERATRSPIVRVKKRVFKPFSIFVTVFFMEISVWIETVFGFRNRKFGSIYSVPLQEY
jgi:hypothetical protein